MATEKYILSCPSCGPVEGYIFDELPEDRQREERGILESDALILAETLDTDNGPAVRLRCPRCGSWIHADRVSQD